MHILQYYYIIITIHKITAPVATRLTSLPFTERGWSLNVFKNTQLAYFKVLEWTQHILILDSIIDLDAPLHPIMPRAFLSFSHQPSAVLPAALSVPWLAPRVVTPDNFSNLLCCVKRQGAHWYLPTYTHTHAHAHTSSHQYPPIYKWSGPGIEFQTCWALLPPACHTHTRANTHTVTLLIGHWLPSQI